ncbi:FAD/NAD-P-binding domain-containing protein [Cylindrobasidium torrendii FP15055 ss-10]|uniref:FAD/NAD-P-binding domain-containing protein n=1 Tax=Cylindrobasidium torrendii FP15055 ss-10 TaxID=1314674 RepID=A0A0D7BQ67_9AGAR|nr:FAD/NAD-P-binding domain-containing protein [Cylindrobasidium torrendii FP15055 ss-10]
MNPNPNVEIDKDGWVKYEVPQEIKQGLWPPSNARGYTIDERPARSLSRRIKVIGIGAGMSGIHLAHVVDTEQQDLIDLTIYEMGDEAGGVWHWNRYPGIACDVPGSNYQYIKDPKTDWSTYYAYGAEIREYYQGQMHKHGLEKYIHFSHEVVGADWNDESGVWTVSIKDLKTGDVKTDTCNLLISMVGSLHWPRWPDLKNLDKYKGTLVHSARYPKDLDLKGKRVAVLGSGSSGVQTVPAIVNEVDHLYHWIRSPTWIVPAVGAMFAGPGGSNFAYSEAQKERFAKDPHHYLAYRKAMESELNRRFRFIIKGSPESRLAREGCEAMMKEKLASVPEIAAKIIPTDFEVGCRRPTPAPGYLDALTRKDKVTVFLDEMQEMSEKGFIDANGTEHEVDVFICATGFDTTFKPHFPVRARGINMQDQWEKEPYSYLSIAVPNFPNFLMAYGPYGPTGHGSAAPIIENTITAFLKIARKMSEEQIVSLEPTEEATREFMEHVELYMKRTVWDGPCSSWFKKGKDGLPHHYPGSRVHFIEHVLQNFRPEDWKFKYRSGNRFRAFGNGFAQRETDGRDNSWYYGFLNEEGKDEMPDYTAIFEEYAVHNK